MQAIFFELGVVIIVATMFALIFRALKQPAIPAYILTGLIMGPFVLNLVKTTKEIEAFSQIGVTFLLFIVGLSLNIKLLREVGRVSLYTGLGQIFFTAIIGFFLSELLGFSTVEALYIGIALAFSSTIIIIKLLSDKGDLEKLYGKISIGFLLVQDAVAVILLIFLSSMKTQGTVENVGIAVVNGFILIAFAYLATKFLLPLFFEKVARSQETLFLAAVSWCFCLSILAFVLGFSIEIGALIAGVCLASLPYSIEIANRVKPLRDFFIILFFFVIGASVSFGSLVSHLPIIFLLSAFVLIGNPLILIAIMGFMGFKTKTGFFVGLTAAQISEFSLIVVAMGYQLGQVSTELVGIVSIVGIITITASTYMVMNNMKLYEFVKPYIKIFERKKAQEKLIKHHNKKKKYDVVLLGQHRIGDSILKKLLRNKQKPLVVDYNPDLIKRLMKKEVPCMYGDVVDPDIVAEIKKYKPKLIISTVHLYEDSLLIVKLFKRGKSKTTVIVTANNVQEALDLYDEGADYVVIPPILGGERVADMLKGPLGKKNQLAKLRNKHIETLLHSELLREETGAGEI